MPRIKRRIRIALWLLLGLFFVAGGLFWYYYVVGMNRVLLHAEAFRFRRMNVAQLNDEGTFRFFYITNRDLAPGDELLPYRFGNKREDTLKFGLFDTTIEPSLGIGMLINPTDWLQNEEIQIENVKALEQDGFVEQLRKFVEASPHRSVLVVIHGYRESYPSALRKTAFVSHVLDIDSPVLLFDWPGNQGGSLRGYRQAREVAQASGAELARALEVIVDEVGAGKIWILANSLGGQVVTDAFSDLYSKGDWSDADTEIEHVVLTAPDVAHDEFDGQFKEEITAMVENLTVYVSSNDRALLASRLVNRGRRRGESTLGNLSPDQWEEAMAVASLVEPESGLVTLVDVTPVNRTRNFHNFSLETPEFFDDLFLRLTNDETPRSRMAYPIKTPEGAVYWVLTRDR
jgi:esterase/lipase superfamily enzyme